MARHKANTAHLQRHFQNPPKGGNATGVPTHNPMSPHPPPQSKHDFYGGGKTMGQRRIDKALDQMSDEEKRQMFKASMGLEPTPTTGPAAVTSLRVAMEAGEASARVNTQESHKAQTDYHPIAGPNTGQQVEFRNYRRSPPDQPVDDDYYVHEHDKDGYAQVGVGNSVAPNPATQRPRPDRNPNPNTTGPRTDGKPQASMGTPDGNPSNYDPARGPLFRGGGFE